MPSVPTDDVAAVGENIKKIVATKPLHAASTNNIVRNSIVAGSVAGIVSTVAVYPFDVLRTKLQSAAHGHVKGSASRRMIFSGSPLEVLAHTWQHGGVRALYTGLSLPLTAQAVYKATVFSANKICQKAIVDFKTFENQKRGIFRQHKLSLSDQFFCGFVGGGVNAAAFVTPVEFIRNQLISQHTKLATQTSASVAERTLTGPIDVIRSTVVSHGITGLWRGVGMTVARDALGCGAFFVSMAYCRQQLTRRGEKPSFGVTLLSGACAGVGFWAVALPLDTVKTWVQNGTAESASKAVLESVSSHGYYRTLLLLTRGWQVAFGRGAPSAAITIGSYEYVYRLMEDV